MITDNDSIRLILGLKVKVLRQEMGLSYQQLAEQTGMSVSYVHDIESGKKFPKADKLLALAKAFGVDYDYMVSLRASKKLQPIIDLIYSGFINAIPWEHFGLSPATLLDLFSDTPDKVTAFISTILKISRSYQLSKENFYQAALRSYQELQDNYFEDIENVVKQFTKQHNWTDKQPLALEEIETHLIKNGITLNRKKLSSIDGLQSIRSFFSEKNNTLYLAKGLTKTQEKFLLAREIAFQHLAITPRPYETILQNYDSFELILNNFKASYFAASLLMQEENFVEDFKNFIKVQKWNEKAWLNLCLQYDVSPEMMMQRLTNILPKHFGIDHLFFLRVAGNVKQHTYQITKELHLSQLHNPYANATNEHYCRRWVSISSLQQQDAASKKIKYPIVQAQISEYWQTHNRYLCITIAKPAKNDSAEMVSVTLGLLIDQKLLQLMPFVNDTNIPVKMVHTTCERCGIMDCKERAAKPIEIIKEANHIKVTEALKLLE